MPDTLDELRRLAERTTPDPLYVRVTGNLLRRAADEIAAPHKLEDKRTRALLFGSDRPPTSKG